MLQLSIQRRRNVLDDKELGSGSVEDGFGTVSAPEGALQPASSKTICMAKDHSA